MNSGTAIQSARTDPLFMLQDVDELAQWIADVEPAYTPGLVDWAVLNGKAGVAYSPEGLRKIVHFYRKVRNRRVRTALAGKTDLHRHS